MNTRKRAAVVGACCAAIAVMVSGCGSGNNEIALPQTDLVPTEVQAPDGLRGYPLLLPSDEGAGAPLLAVPIDSSACTAPDFHELVSYPFGALDVHGPVSQMLICRDPHTKKGPVTSHPVEPISPDFGAILAAYAKPAPAGCLYNLEPYSVVINDHGKARRLTTSSGCLTPEISNMLRTAFP